MLLPARKSRGRKANLPFHYSCAYQGGRYNGTPILSQYRRGVRREGEGEGEREEEAQSPSHHILSICVGGRKGKSRKNDL